jgi:hypothetical protein
MESLAVDLQLLRSLMVADLKLSVGRMLTARVADVQANGRGTISLAGTLLEAELPKELAAGQTIHLQVRELTPEKVVLALTERPPVLEQPVPMPLPGGGLLAVQQHPESEAHGGSQGESRHTLRLVYEAPSLGAMEMSFVLDPASLRLDVVLGAGEPHALASQHAADLREALSAALGRTITLSILPRRQPVEIYA